MRPNVVRVLVLVRHGILVLGRRAFDEGPGQRNRPVLGMIDGAEVVGRGPNLGAEHPQDDLLFFGHAVGDRHHEFLAQQRRKGRQGDARIAGTRLDQVLAVEFSPLGHSLEQIERRAVLDRAERIEPFELGIELEFARRHDPRQTDQRGWIGRAGDQLADLVIAPQSGVGVEVPRNASPTLGCRGCHYRSPVR